MQYTQRGVHGSGSCMAAGAAWQRELALKACVRGTEAPPNWGVLPFGALSPRAWRAKLRGSAIWGAGGLDSRHTHSRFLMAVPNCEARNRASLMDTHGRPERSSERVAPSSSWRGSGWWQPPPPKRMASGAEAEAEAEAVEAVEAVEAAVEVAVMVEEEAVEDVEESTPRGVTNAKAHFARGMPLWWGSSEGSLASTASMSSPGR